MTPRLLIFYIGAGLLGLLIASAMFVGCVAFTLRFFGAAP